MKGSGYRKQTGKKNARPGKHKKKLFICHSLQNETPMLRLVILRASYKQDAFKELGVGVGRMGHKITDVNYPPGQTRTFQRANSRAL